MHPQAYLFDIREPFGAHTDFPLCEYLLNALEHVRLTFGMAREHFGMKRKREEEEEKEPKHFSLIIDYRDFLFFLLTLLFFVKLQICVWIFALLLALPCVIYHIAEY